MSVHCTSTLPCKAQLRPIHHTSDSEDDDVTNNLIVANVNSIYVIDLSSDDMGFVDSMAQGIDQQLGSAINSKMVAIMQNSFTKNIRDDKMKTLTVVHLGPQN